MNQTLLKKQFSSKDLQRARNLIQRKYTEKVEIKSGYSTPYVERIEGEEWVEDGKTWVIENGIKICRGKLEALNIQIPVFCPECTYPMKHRLDKDFYKKYGVCMECQIKRETESKIRNTYDAKNLEIFNQELDLQIEAFSEMFDEELENISTKFITEGGESQEWTKMRREKFSELKKNILDGFEISRQKYNENNK